MGGDAGAGTVARTGEEAATTIVRSRARAMIQHIRKALHRTGRIVANAAIDLRCGSWLGPRRGGRGRRMGSHNSDYRVLEQVFAGRIRPDDVLVDVGCSYGRVLNFWLRTRRGNRIVGIELDPHAAASTAARLRRYPNVEVLTGSADEQLPQDGTVFYLFNPFGADELARFAALVRELPATGDRPLIVYYNCKHVEVFERHGEWRVERVELAASSDGPLSPLALITPR